MLISILPCLSCSLMSTQKFMSCKILRLRLSSYYKWTFWSKNKAQRVNYSLMDSFLLVQEWWIIFSSLSFFSFFFKHYFISSHESFFTFFHYFSCGKHTKKNSLCLNEICYFSFSEDLYFSWKCFFRYKKKRCTSLEPLFHYFFSQFFCIKRSFIQYTVSIYYGSILCYWPKSKL